MLYRSLGRTGLNVSLLSYGTGGPRLFGQNEGMDRTGQIALVRRCLDLGINLFDTARGYGQSEPILGECLKGIPRDSYHLITKWRFEEEPTEPQEDNLAHSIDNSLRTLGTDHIEIYMLHGLTDIWYDDGVERYYPILERSREQGKIGAIGLSTQFITDPPQKGALIALSRNPRTVGRNDDQVRHPQPARREGGLSPRARARCRDRQHGRRARPAARPRTA